MPVPAQKPATDAASIRIRRLVDSLEKQETEGLVIGHLPNIRYLFAFTGSTATALLSARGNFLFLDSRYTIQGGQETVACTVEEALPSADEALARKIIALGLRSVAVEGAYLTLNRFNALRKSLPSRVAIQPRTGVIEGLRAVKTIDEIEEIRRTLRLTTQAFDAIIPAVKPGIRERDVAAELEYQLRKHGARKPSFDTIVASGARSAMPHGLASDKVLQKNEFVVIDFGAYREGYASDVTRTLFLGKPSSEHRKVYRTVLDAVRRAEERTRPALKGRSVDRLAREHIEKAGFGVYFGHGAGHGIGLEVHEAPFIHPRQEERICTDMVFTIEPGIYLPDRGGVRIEDIVRVTPSGCEVLTSYTKELIVL